MAQTPERSLQRLAIAFGDQGLSNEMITLLLSIAAEMGSSLRAMLIEDDDLKRFASLPFAQEICRVSLSPKPIDAAAFDRLNQRRVRGTENAFAQGARQRGLEWSYERKQGRPESILEQAVQSSDILAIMPLPRTVPQREDFRHALAAAPGLTVAKQVKPILAVVHDRDHAERILAFAAQLSNRTRQPLSVLAAPSDPNTSDELLDWLRTQPSVNARRLYLSKQLTPKSLSQMAHMIGASSVAIGATKTFTSPSGLKALNYEMDCLTFLVH